MRLAALLAALTGVASWAIPAASAPKPARPRLGVLLYFDQFRGDYLARWRGLYEKDGFRRLTDDGAWFVDCHYPYANTLTGPGHATCATGCPPSVHGIVANEWYVRNAGKETNCVSTVRWEQIPPPVTKPKEKDKKDPTSAAPDLLLAPSIGDALKAATDGKGKVVALSLKDRSCVLPGGKRPDAVYWVDKDGQFVTSTYYRDAVHPWVAELNRARVGSRWRDLEWTKLRPRLDYALYSGPDDVRGEGKGASQGVTFPHPFDGGPKKSRTVYHEAVAQSPMGSELLLEAAKRAIDAEALGTRDVPDLLSLSFSSTDLVGHIWGPDSQEVLDSALRADLLVRDLLRYLDDKVGKDRYVVVMSADHGIPPLPEVARARGLKAGRVNPKHLMEEADEYLEACYPPEGGPVERPAKAWVEAGVSNMVYLNRALCRARGTTVPEVARRLAPFLAKQPGVEAALTADELSGTADLKYATPWRRSFVADRCGDVMLVMKPYHFLSTLLTGTTHGSPHPYDTHVPLVAFGPGVRPGVRKERVSPEAAAVILAAGLGIAPPAKAAVRVPAGLFAESLR